MLETQPFRTGKYIYLAILAYWVAGVLVAGYAFAYCSTSIPADILPPALLAGYLTSISLLVFQSYGRNMGLSLLFSIMVPCVPWAVGAPWLLPLSALGLTMAAWLRRRNIGESIGRIGAAEIAALVAASAVFSIIALRHIHNIPWDVSREDVHIDTIFHSALSAMIKNYGVSSTGLDGFVTLNYHVFSHVLFAALSFSTGLPVVATYGTAQYIVYLPLLLLAIVATAETIRPSTNAPSFFLRIAVLFAAFNTIEAWPAFRKFMVGSSYAGSLSYQLSLTLMMATICATRMERDGYRLATLTMLVMLATASKVSTGAICVAIVSAHLALFDSSTTIKRIVAGVLMVIASCALILLEFPNMLKSMVDTGALLKYAPIIIGTTLVTAGASLIWLRRKTLHKYAVLACALCTLFIAAYFWLHPQLLASSGIQRLSFLRTYVGLPDDWGKPGFWPMLGKFTLLQFFFTWLLFALAANLYFFDKNKATSLRAPLLYSLVALGISWLVIFFARLSTASEFYFINIAMFIALPYLLTMLSHRISSGGMLRDTMANIVPFIVLVSLLSSAFAIERGKGLFSFVPTTQQTTQHIETPISKRKEFVRIVDLLKEIRDDLSTKNLGVYVAKEEKEFWGQPSTSGCGENSFIIPAVSERPSLLALPGLVDCPVLGLYYGYDQYQHKRFEMSSLVRTPHETLLKLAGEAGLDGYVDVRASGWTVYKREQPSNNVSPSPKGS